MVPKFRLQVRRGHVNIVDDTGTWSPAAMKSYGIHLVRDPGEMEKAEEEALAAAESREEEPEGEAMRRRAH